MSKHYVMMEFTGSKAKVSYNIGETNQLFIAATILEGMIGRVTGLGAEEIRELIDQIKQETVVKPDTEDVIDVET